MKINFDTILYIVITLAILLISGLGSRRKKKLQQMKVPFPPGSGEDDSDTGEKDSSFSGIDEPARTRYQTGPYQPLRTESPSARQPSMDPIERLEQFLTGQQPMAESMEGESLESTFDEEELILEQIRKDREETEPEMPSKEIEVEPVNTVKPGQKEFTELFKGTGEIKKAIIYSEILKRKYI